jgi:hypothetical protein
MKELFKKFWEKIEALTIKIWEKIKAWVIKTAVPWLKKSWVQIVNILVVAFAYAHTDSLPGTQFIVGAWLFLLLGYYIFWKLFGLEKVIKGNKLNPQPEPPKPIESVEPLVSTADVPKVRKAKTNKV